MTSSSSSHSSSILCSMLIFLTVCLFGASPGHSEEKHANNIELPPRTPGGSFSRCRYRRALGSWREVARRVAILGQSVYALLRLRSSSCTPSKEPTLLQLCLFSPCRSQCNLRMRRCPSHGQVCLQNSMFTECVSRHGEPCQRCTRNSTRGA